MKIRVVILLAIVIFIGNDVVAMSSSPSDFKNMSCHVTTPDTKGCTGIPTLRSGLLTISKDGTFKLKAHYDGCFFIEDVTKSGKYLAAHFKNNMSLELLSTNTTGEKDVKTNFPRTLGFANLNDDKLDGYLVDISAVIRGRGRHTKNVTISKLQCESYE